MNRDYKLRMKVDGRVVWDSPVADVLQQASERVCCAIIKLMEYDGAKIEDYVLSITVHATPYSEVIGYGDAAEHLPAPK